MEVKESLFHMLLSPSDMTNFDVMEIASMLHIKYDTIFYHSCNILTNQIALKEITYQTYKLFING